MSVVILLCLCAVPLLLHKSDNVVLWPWPPVQVPINVTWGVHNSYIRNPSWAFQNTAQPNFAIQHAAGARLFEIDVFWWMQTQWIVAHVPVFDAASHVTSLVEAVCTLRVLPKSVMFLDVKQYLFTPSKAAQRALVHDLSACSHWGPLTALVDVTCNGPYNNVQLANHLAHQNIVNTTLQFRGLHWWWLRVQCSGNVNELKFEVGTPCKQFREPDNAADVSTAATAPLLYECGHCPRLEKHCVAVAYNRSAPQVYVQTKTWFNHSETRKVYARAGKMHDTKSL